MTDPSAGPYSLPPRHTTASPASPRAFGGPTGTPSGRWPTRFQLGNDVTRNTRNASAPLDDAGFRSAGGDSEPHVSREALARAKFTVEPRGTESATREGILKLLAHEGPALLSDLAHELNVDRTTILYHARRLARRKLVTIDKRGRNTFVTLVDVVAPDAPRHQLSGCARTILELLGERGGAITRDELERRLRAFAPGIRRHALRRLVALGLIERRRPAEILTLTASLSTSQNTMA